MFITVHRVFGPFYLNQCECVVRRHAEGERVWTQGVRNRILHGQNVEEKDFRKAVVAIIEYAEEFNQKFYDLGGFRPFGRIQGFKGAGAYMEKSTSRWVLKGIGLPID